MTPILIALLVAAGLVWWARQQRSRSDPQHPHLPPLPSWEERKARIEEGAQRLAALRNAA